MVAHAVSGHAASDGTAPRHFLRPGTGAELPLVLLSFGQHYIRREFWLYTVLGKTQRSGHDRKASSSIHGGDRTAQASWNPIYGPP